MSSELEKYIRNNLDELDQKKPDDAVLGRILATMKATGKDKPTAPVRSMRLWKWAAACLLVTAGGIAAWYYNQQPQPTHAGTTNIPPIRPQPVPKTELVVQPPVTIPGEHVARYKKTVVPPVKAPKTELLAGLSNMQSAATRINAVFAASRMKYKSKGVADALVQTLNNDPNANVRLAALDGLTRYHNEPSVRRKLVASLNNQQDPVVQINLIDLLAGMQEVSALSGLEKMANDENTNTTVRDVAWAGILQLRHR